jgi:UDP-glucose-4-epimerase GalE
MTTILVTGGAGYLGCHVLLPLIEQGYQPIVFDNLSSGHRALTTIHPGIKLVEGDIADRQLLRRTLEKYRIGAVLHLASERDGDSWHPNVNHTIEQLYASNGVNTQILLEELVNYQANNPPPVVYCSSCSIHGAPHDNRLRESTTKAPATPYGRSKLTAEWILEDMGRCHGISHVILRSCNVAGAQLQNETGEWHEPETHLIPRALRAAREQTVLPIHGMNFPTPDGTAVRDFMHICDLAAAHISALNYLLAGGASTAFNVGTGTGYSLLEVVHAVERITQSKVRLQDVGRRENDPAWRVCDASKAREVLQWVPHYSDLDVIVGDAAAWDAHVHSRREEILV